MGSAAVGAVLGVAAQELYRATGMALGRATSFRHKLELLQATLRTVTPKINQIDQLASRNRKSFPRELQEEIQMFRKLLVRGKDLVMTCSEIPRWRIWKRCRYAKKMTTLNESLANLVRVQLPGAQLDFILRILCQMNKMNQNLLRKDIQHEFSSIPNQPSTTNETTNQNEIKTVNCCSMCCFHSPTCLGSH